jgi:hypothetical protein
MDGGSIHISNLVSGPLYSFAFWKDAGIPIATAGVYSIWDSVGTLIYVGMSGRGMSNEHLVASQLKGHKRGLYTRLDSHASGVRSGDQFCVYVADRFVLPALTPEEIVGISKRELIFDHLVKKYIHTHLHFRYTTTHDGKEAEKLEIEARFGALGSLPFLNSPVQ